MPVGQGCPTLTPNLDSDFLPDGCGEPIVAIAREIATKLIEVRATTGLARFLARHGGTDEARARLVPLYAWFTELLRRA